jgi:hypothetical protein
LREYGVGKIVAVVGENLVLNVLPGIVVVVGERAFVGQQGIDEKKKCNNSAHVKL